MNIPELNRTSLILVAATSAAGLLISSLFMLPLADRIGWATLLIGLCFVIAAGMNDKKVLPPLIVAFFLRVGWAVFEYYIVPMVWTQAVTDPDGYGVYAEFVAMGGPRVLFENFKPGASFSPWFTGLLYYLFAKSQLMSQGLGVFFGSLIVLFVYKTARIIWSPKIALLSAWVIALHPNMIRFAGSFASREVAVVFPLTVSIYLLVRWNREGKLLQLLLALAFQMVALFSHTGIVALLFAEVVYFVYQSYRHLLTNRLRQGMAFAVVFALALGAIFIIHSTGWGMDKFGGSLDSVSTDDIIKIQNNPGGRAGYLQGMKPKNAIDILWQAPIRTVYFLFSPLPWMIRSTKHLLGIIDSLIYIFFIASMWMSRRYILKSKPAQIVFIGFFSLALIFGIAVNNFGTAIRHRAKIAPLAACLMVSTPLWRSEQKRSRQTAARKKDDE